MTPPIDRCQHSGPRSLRRWSRRPAFDGDVLVPRRRGRRHGPRAVGAIALMIWNSIQTTIPVFQKFGIWDFVTGSRWAPSFTIYGAWPFIYGTLLTALIACLIAVPVALLIALLLTEVLPPRVAGPVAVGVDMLAAVPSVVWGLWGLLVLVPFIRPVEQAVAGSVGQAIPFFGPPTPGPELLRRRRDRLDHDHPDHGRGDS